MTEDEWLGWISKLMPAFGKVFVPEKVIGDCRVTATLYANGVVDIERRKSKHVTRERRVLVKVGKEKWE
jgi:hypothetical protein